MQPGNNLMTSCNLSSNVQSTNLFKDGLTFDTENATPNSSTFNSAKCSSTLENQIRIALSPLSPGKYFGFHNNVSIQSLFIIV